jgi:hypothetical protein
MNKNRNKTDQDMHKTEEEIGENETDRCENK